MTLMILSGYAELVLPWAFLLGMMLPKRMSRLPLRHFKNQGRPRWIKPLQGSPYPSLKGLQHSFRGLVQSDKRLRKDGVAQTVNSPPCFEGHSPRRTKGLPAA